MRCLSDGWSKDHYGSAVEGVVADWALAVKMGLTRSLQYSKSPQVDQV